MKVVTSYVNPDTDGVACMLAFQAWTRAARHEAWLCYRYGELNPETSAVLEVVGSNGPRELLDFSRASAIVLVDTHHVRQLPEGLPLDRVVEIIDHHPAGDEERFPGAVIDNQKVGAAATILIERIQRDAVTLDSTVAGLLEAAVLSNTHDLRAPSTSPRDRAALGWLRKTYGANAAVAQAIASSRTNMLNLPLAQLLSADVKIFSFLDTQLAISQVEAPGASRLAESPTFVSQVRDVKERLGYPVLLINLVDLQIERSRLWCDDPCVWTALESKIDLERNGSDAWAARMLLRKSDLIPALGG